MEGDAGAGRLNPTDAADSSSPKVTSEDLQESGSGLIHLMQCAVVPVKPRLIGRLGSSS